MSFSKTLEGHTHWVFAVTTGTLDGRAVVVSGSADHHIKVWDAEKGTLLKTLSGQDPKLAAPCVDALGGHQLPIWFGGHLQAVMCVATCTINGKLHVASGASDYYVKVWDVESAKCLKTLDGHKWNINGVATCTLGGRAVVASCSSDKTVRLWDMEGESGNEWRKIPEEQKNSAELKVLKGHTEGVSAVATCTVGGKLVVVSGGWDKVIRMWDAESGATIKTLEGHTACVCSLEATTLNGRVAIVSGALDKLVGLWDAERGALIKTLSGHKGGVKGATTVTLNGRVMVVSGSEDKTLRLWGMKTKDN